MTCICERLKKDLGIHAATPYPAGLVIVSQGDWEHLGEHGFLVHEFYVPTGNLAKLADGTVVIPSTGVSEGAPIVIARAQLRAYVHMNTEREARP